MLYYPIGANKPSRVQGAFVSDEELNRVTDFIKQQAIPVEYSDEVTNVVLPSDSQKEAKNATAGGGDAPEEQGQDELLDDAIRLVLDLGQASASMLQRRFRIGYNRAAAGGSHGRTWYCGARYRQQAAGVKDVQGRSGI